ncbi:MAG: PA2779 family protein [Alphaproteobacteria bacterium]|nr:PA2779 family protein [Alphaproteobacteria bacterium]
MLTTGRCRHAVACTLILAMMMLSLPHHQASAAMAGTESATGPAAAAQSSRAGAADAERARIKALLQRQEVREELLSHGIGAKEARARIDALTDAEIAAIVRRLDALPAGGASGTFAGFGSAAEAAIALHVFAAVLVVALVAVVIAAAVRKDGPPPGSEAAPSPESGPDASYRFGIRRFRDGRLREGFESVCRAAHRGHGGAQNAMGLLYEGRAKIYWGSRQLSPVQTDLVGAHIWYGAAADQGNREAAFFRSRLEQRMTAAERAAAARAKEASGRDPASCQLQESGQDTRQETRLPASRRVDPTR